MDQEKKDAKIYLIKRLKEFFPKGYKENEKTIGLHIDTFVNENEAHFISSMKDYELVNHFERFLKTKNQILIEELSNKMDEEQMMELIMEKKEKLASQLAEKYFNKYTYKENWYAIPFCCELVESAIQDIYEQEETEIPDYLKVIIADIELPEGYDNIIYYFGKNIAERYLFNEYFQLSQGNDVREGMERLTRELLR